MDISLIIWFDVTYRNVYLELTFTPKKKCIPRILKARIFLVPGKSWKSDECVGKEEEPSNLLGSSSLQTQRLVQLL